MGATGKVKTIFTDKEKTEAIFPRTKVSAVSDDNGVGLNALLTNMLYAGSNGGATSTIPVNADTLGGRPAADYATQNFVTNKIAEAQLDGGESGSVDLSGYATKDYVDDALNNKLDVGNGVAYNLKTDTLVIKPREEEEGVYFSGGLDVGAQGRLEILGTYEDEPVRLGGLAYPEVYNDAVCKGYADETYMPITAQFAPAGYGLGAGGKAIASGDDLNNYKVGGFYQFTSGVANTPTNYGIMLVIPGTGYLNDTFQYVFSRYPANNMAIRQLFEGEWGEWEWINPPMAVNTEYRTTERMLGKPVYKKVISYTSEAMTTAGNSFSIAHGITGLGQIININAFTNDYTLPYSSASGTLNISSYSSTNLTMINVGTTWAAGRTWYIELKYTKS